MSKGGILLPTIDELLRQIDKERELAEEYHNMAMEIKDNDELKRSLLAASRNEEEQAYELENKIGHLLEKEEW